jgi:putative thioredoxin
MSADYELKNFEKEVVEKSKTIPVLIDFWAPWCQPCKSLSPVLEELARENKGRFVLVTINTDEKGELAQQFGIKSIPAVKLVFEGKIIAEFNGALPKKQIIDFLDKNIPKQEQKDFETLKVNFRTLEKKQAIKKLSEYLGSPSEQDEASVLLAFLMVMDQPEDAKKLMSSFMEDSPFFMEAQSIIHLADFLLMKEGDLQESNVRENLLKAIQYLKNADIPDAMEELIYSIMVNKAYMDELGRKICVAIFMVLGDDHEISQAYRRRFSMALY